MVSPMNNDDSHHYSVKRRPLGKTKHQKNEKGLQPFFGLRWQFFIDNNKPYCFGT